MNVFELAISSGDQGTASHATLAIVRLLFYEGLPIQKVRAIIESYSPFVNRTGNQECKMAISGILEMLLLLSGEKSDSLIEAVLKRGDSPEAHIEVRYDLKVSALLVALILDEIDEAGLILNRIKALNYRSYTIFYYLELIGELLFFVGDLKNTPSNPQITRRIAVIRDEFDSLAIENPANFLFPFLLSKGVMAEMNGRLNNALLEYRSAIAAASKFQFLHFNAITHERIAAILFKTNKLQEARSELKQALNSYKNYGAFSKVKCIEDQINTIGKTN